MYFPGNIIYYTPFYFANNTQPKPKYCIILTALEGNVLFTLTTRTDCVPCHLEKTHGCIDNSEMKVNCYCFHKERTIAKNGWGFPLETFIYGEWLKILPIENFQLKYKIENVDYQLIGELTNNELDSIISCMRDSKSVSRKYRRLLGVKI